MFSSTNFLQTQNQMCYYNSQMKRQVENKRHQFAFQIRRKQHNKYFQINRKWKEGTLTALSFLSILLEDKMYDKIQQVLDEITLNSETAQCDFSIIQTISRLSRDHADQSIKILMFKLLNRIGQWQHNEVKEAMSLYSKGMQDMLKQLALFLDRLSRKNEKKWKQMLVIIFPLVFNKPTKQKDLLIYWLDIVCEGIDSQNCLKQQNVNELLLVLEGGIIAGDQYDLSRILKIANKIIASPQVSQKFVQMQHFHKIIQLMQDCTIDVLSEGLEMIAQLLSSDQQTISLMVRKSNTMKILRMYSNHCLSDIQVQTFWALSNIAGSQQWIIIFQSNPEPIMNKIAELVKQKNSSPNLLSQLYFCYLNLFCSVDEKYIIQLLTNYHGFDVLVLVSQEVKNPHTKNLYFERLLFSIFSIAKKCPQQIPQLEALGIKNFLNCLYQQQKNQSFIEILQNTMEALENQH